MEKATLAPLAVIVGETASGKSALALELAKRFNGEIICADSWTVYKGFNVGTAKPSAEEREQIPHYLLDVTTADKGFSAPEFKRLAEDAIRHISSRGKLPIMVGGTGLYIDSIIYDYSFLPPSDAAERQQLNELSLDQLIMLAKKRGLSLSQIDTRNKRRIIRLVENNGQLPTRSELRSSTLLLGLAPDRDTLRARIVNRVEAMLLAGLEREVAALAAKYSWQTEPMKGVGYREWQSYFAGNQTLEETKEKIIKSSLDLAKKQRTWFRRNKSIQWLSNRGELEQAVDLITTFLNK